MKTLLGIFAAIATFLVLLTIFLYLNNWGRSVPDDVDQLLWAFAFVIWPVGAYLAVKS